MTYKQLQHWFSPTALIIYSLVPLVVTGMRLTWFITTPEAEMKTSEFAHFAEIPAPILAHIICGSLFCILAALQFTPNMALKRPALHRWNGRTAFICGIVASVTGAAMVLIYPANELTNEVTSVFKFTFGAIMTITLALAYKTARKRNFNQHRAWMSRSLAIGLGGSTQLLLIIGIMLIAGKLTPPALTIAMGMGWTINLAFAEWRIYAGQTFTRQNRGAITA